MASHEKAHCSKATELTDANGEATAVAGARVVDEAAVDQRCLGATLSRTNETDAVNGANAGGHEAKRSAREQQRAAREYVKTESDREWPGFVTRTSIAAALETPR